MDNRTSDNFNQKKKKTTTCNFLVSCLKTAYFKQTNGSAHLFPISVFSGIWSSLRISFDSWTEGVWGRERDGHLTGGDRPRSQGGRERGRVRRGRRVEGWRGWETDGDSALAVSLRGDKQPIWDLSRKEKEMEIREREGIWRNAKWGEDDFFS